jgi:hypothetical protein
MNRIDSANNVPALPAPVAAEGAPGYFNNAPGAGPGTKVTGDWLNMVQEEISGVIEGAGLILDRTNHGQLLAALRLLTQGLRFTGERVGYTGRNALPGWILGNGLTIGNAASNATNRANADTQALFTLYFTDYADAELPIKTSAGAGTTRAALGSVAAAWAANCQITVPDYSDRGGLGRGDMSGADVGTVTGGATLGKKIGSPTKVIGVPNLPPGTPTLAGNSGSGGGTPVAAVADAGGAAAPMDVMNPFTVETFLIKL